MLRPAPALLCALLAGCPAHGGPAAPPAAGPPRLDERHDGAVRATVVRIVPGTDCAAPRLLAGATLEGGRAPEQVLIGIRACGSEWRYEGCARIALVADGVQIADGPALRDVQAGGGTLVEFLTTAVPLAAVARLAWSGRAALRACGTETPLEAEDRAQLSRFVKRVSPP